MLPREHAGELHFFDLLLQPRKNFPYFRKSGLIAFSLSEFGQDKQIFKLLRRLFPGFNNLLQTGALPDQPLGLLPPVPEIRLGYFRLEL